MNINYKQPQFELFPANSAMLEDVNKPRFLLANLTLSMESLVILAILGIMVALFSFSIGVERGKHLAAQTLDERVTAAWSVGARKAISTTPLAKSALPVGKVAMPAALVPSTQSLKGNNGFVVGRSKSVPPLTVAHAVSQPVVPKPVVYAKAGAPTVRFTLQAATYLKEEFARKDGMELKAKGFQSFLIKSGKFWILCVGNFTGQDSAQAFAHKMPTKYRSSKVRRF